MYLFYVVSQRMVDRRKTEGEWGDKQRGVKGWTLVFWTVADDVNVEKSTVLSPTQ